MSGLLRGVQGGRHDHDAVRSSGRKPIDENSKDMLKEQVRGTFDTLVLTNYTPTDVPQGCKIHLESSLCRFPCGTNRQPTYVDCDVDMGSNMKCGATAGTVKQLDMTVRYTID